MKLWFRNRGSVDNDRDVTFLMVCRHLLFEGRDLGLLRQIVALKFHIALLQLHNFKFEIANVFSDWQIRRLDRQLESLRRSHGGMPRSVVKRRCATAKAKKLRIPS